jgi:Trypsin-like peptidase domain
MNIRDQLVHTTVRITTNGPDGCGAGTGFFMDFCSQESSQIPAIVTNKHVVAGTTEGKFYFTAKKGNSDEPDLGALIPVPVAEFEKNWLLHPDPTVDLAVFPIAPVLRWLEGNGQRPFYKNFTTHILADTEFLASLTAIEDILMIGYPIGLWDSRHNFPIVRRGITATPPYVDFDGRTEFVIDCACFPGSSGSPVLLYDHGGYIDKEGNSFIGPSRIKFVGILYAGPQHTTRGDIQVVPIPTSVKPVAISRIPTNLGYCIKADRLRYFEEYFQKDMAAETADTTANAD